MASGWIALHRQIQENSLWQDNEPFDCRSAWIDMLLMANHEDKELFMNNNVILIKRGQFHRSQLKLAERWHWKRDKVKKYLKSLKKAGMLDFVASKNGDTRGTTITIVNYGKYQDCISTKSTTKRTSNQHQEGQQNHNSSDINNNVNNVNNVITMNNKKTNNSASGGGFFGGEWE